MTDLKLASGTTTTPPRSGVDQRREPRFAIREAVSIMVVWPGEPERLTGFVEDISRSGVGITTSQPLTPGSSVFVRLRRSGIFGSIRHCRELGPGSYRAGLSIDHVVTPKTITNHLAMGGGE